MESLSDLVGSLLRQGAAALVVVLGVLGILVVARWLTSREDRRARRRGTGPDSRRP